MENCVIIHLAQSAMEIYVWHKAESRACKMSAVFHSVYKLRREFSAQCRLKLWPYVLEKYVSSVWP